MYKNFFKRIFDILFSLSLLITVSPVLVIVAISLYFANNGSIFFYQQRPGKGEKIFRIMKFKTMNDGVDENGKLLSDSDRLTKTGRFVRKTSLDEIPQLVNILKGDMSLIGPRPLLQKYLPYYSEQERKRHTVLPGITGLAQISGRNLLGWDERLKKDCEYVDSISFKTDIKIFFKTIKNVIQSKDNISDPRSVMLDLDDERKQA
jgi:lipopolysaccharide/colanic/teichoic acid biosynthesis glycosyltransferase